MFKPVFYWTLVILYAALIFYLSSGPMPITIDIPESDKIGHMGEYGIFSLLLYKALRSSFKNESAWKIAILSIIVTLLYGISDEFHQIFVPTRTADPYDVAADASGAIIMQGIIHIKKRFFA